jgi:hypothetical protein
MPMYHFNGPFPQQAMRMDCCQPNFQRVFLSFCNASKCPLETQTCVWAAPDTSCLPKSMFLHWQKISQILTYTKDFSLKKLPKIVRFYEEKNSKLPDFSQNLQKVAKNIEGGILFFSLLSYLGCSQIWLNCFMDDCHFGYITT